MAQHTENAITSMSSLQSTIETDKHVFRWFMYLITEPAVKSDIILDQNTQKRYDQLKTTISYQRISCLFLLCLLFFTYYSKQYLLLFLGAALLCFCIILHQKIRKMVSQISIHLISQDFQQSNFDQKTLYQIGEFYGRKYKIKSLVIAMTSVDAIIRRMVLYALIFATFILPSNFFQFWMLVMSTYYIAYAITHMSLIYNRL